MMYYIKSSVTLNYWGGTAEESGNY